DIGKNSFHVVGLNDRGAIVLRQKWSRGQIEARLANMPPCLIGMEACVGAHHLSRKLKAFGHDARLMPQQADFMSSRPMEYRGIRHTICVRIERQHWTAAIRPGDVEIPDKLITSSRQEAELQAN